MKLAIVDDEISQQNLEEKYILDWSRLNKQQVKVYKFCSSESFLFSWEDNKDYDLLILDIEMKEMNGLELAKRIRREDKDIPILFVTGYDEYMQYGYDVAAIHYLIKPLNKEKFCLVLDSLNKREESNSKILVTSSEGNRCFLISEIMYAEARSHQCVLHLREEEILLKESFGCLEKRIMDKAEFIKTHRAYIVNMKYVSMILKTDVLLDNREKVPLSRNTVKHVQESFLNFYRTN